jgi:hypothetical protein
VEGASADETAARRPVWARKGVGLHECPTSFITAASLRWIEEYFTRRRLGGWRVEELSARDAEAFGLLDELLCMEKENG